MKKHLKTITIAAGTVLAATAIVVAAKHIGGTAAPQEFVMFRQLQPGEDPMTVAKQYMGTGLIENKGLFTADFRTLDDPHLVGMFL